MKRAVLLHGTDGNPEGNWFPWLRLQLEDRGYDVLAPLLPQNHRPNAHIYNDFLLSQDWEYKDNLIIGHSSGAVSILNILLDPRFPKIKTGVLVGAWNNLEVKDFDTETFVNLFPSKGFDFERIKTRADNILFVHSTNDPWCPLEQAQDLASNLDSELVIIEGGQHFVKSLDPEYEKFPELIDILSQRKLL